MDIKYTKTGIIINGEEEISLQSIISKVKLTKIEEDNLVLLKIVWPEDRNFDGCYEYTVYSMEKALKIKEILSGRTINFGEIAGKHSEIFGTVEESEIQIIINPHEVLEFLKSHPNGAYCNHSFLQRLSDNIYDGEEEDLTEEDIIW